MKQLEILSAEKFNLLTVSDKWVNDIQHAVKCCDKNGNFKYFRSCSYPVEYIVSEEQIQQAKEMAEERKHYILENIKQNDLVFVAMGRDYSGTPGDVQNHRIRCNFKNIEGKRFFIELIKCNNDGFYIDFSIDLDKQEENEKKRIIDLFYPQTEYNAKGVEKTKVNAPFTFENVLQFVNETYNCCYTNARLIRHFVRCEDFINTCAYCYTMEQWSKDGTLKVQIGQLVDDNVFTQLFECMPPSYYARDIFQPGEAYDHDADNGAPLYMTFKNTSSGWQYMGICRTGETVQRVGYCSQFLAV